MKCHCLWTKGNGLNISRLGISLLYQIEMYIIGLFCVLHPAFAIFLLVTSIVLYFPHNVLFIHIMANILACLLYIVCFTVLYKIKGLLLIQTVGKK